MYAKPMQLRILEPPLPLPRLQVQQIWHKRAAHDLGLQRLRETIRSTFIA